MKNKYCQPRLVTDEKYFINEVEIGWCDLSEALDILIKNGNKGSYISFNGVKIPYDEDKSIYDYKEYYETFLGVDLNNLLPKRNIDDINKKIKTLKTIKKNIKRMKNYKDMSIEELKDNYAPLVIYYDHVDYSKYTHKKAIIEILISKGVPPFEEKLTADELEEKLKESDNDKIKEILWSLFVSTIRSDLVSYLFKKYYPKEKK